MSHLRVLTSWSARRVHSVLAVRFVLPAILVVLAGLSAAPAHAGSTQTMAIQDDGSFQEPGYAHNAFCTTGDPACNLNFASTQGPGAIRIIIYWNAAAPSPSSCTQPAVDLSAISSYNATYVARLAQEIATAGQDGLSVYIAFGGPFPCWASLHPDAAHCPSPATCTDEPDPALYADFVHAFAARFGASVARWSPYNEPDNASFLTPQTTGSNDPYTALMYRHLWYVGRAEIQQFSSAPLWFGETSGNGATNPTPITRFINFALCDSGAAEISQDPVNYPSCSGVGPAPAAEAISFHFYGGAGLLPQDNLHALDTMSGILLDNQARGTFPTPGYIAQTEHGWRTSPNGVSDDAQQKYNTCDEENAYKNHQLIETSQYELQDPPPGRGGDLHTGLITQSVNGSQGVLRNSMYAWIFPITVYRRSDGKLEVWGSARADYFPHDYVILHGYKNGVLTYTRNISLSSARYYYALLTDAPTGLVWSATASRGSGLTRTATGTDCGSGWTGGNPAH